MTTLDDDQTATEVGPLCADCGYRVSGSGVCSGCGHTIGSATDRTPPDMPLPPAETPATRASVSAVFIIAVVVLALLAVAVVAIVVHH